jgi:hypothetical protein
MQDKINALKTKWQEEEKKHGVVIEDYEKLYEFNMLYAEAIADYHYFEAQRKILKDALYLKYRETAKTQRDAEALARTDERYKAFVDKLRVLHKDYYTLKALSTRIQGRIESTKAQEIKTNIEKKATINSGQGGH